MCIFTNLLIYSYYKNVVIYEKNKYNMENSRNNSSVANLLILKYFEGKETFSNLLNSFQKSRGVASFRKSDYSLVTNGMVINVEGPPKK